MVSPSWGALRFVRAGAWATAAMGLSTGAHLVGGGAPPSPGAAALIVTALLWSGLILTQWRLGRTALAVSLGLSQVLLHSVLTVSEGVTDCAPVGDHHNIALACAGGSPMPHETPVAMFLAHVVAALLLALVLARGEDAVWFLAGLLRPSLPGTPLLLLLTGHELVPARGDQPARLPFVLGGVGRRGPPGRRAPAVA